MAPFKDVPRPRRAPGWPGPSGCKQAAEALSKYIVTDMYAKAVQGVPFRTRSSGHTAELVKVYG